MSPYKLENKQKPSLALLCICIWIWYIDGLVRGFCLSSNLWTLSKNNIFMFFYISQKKYGTLWLWNGRILALAYLFSSDNFSGNPNLPLMLPPNCVERFSAWFPQIGTGFALFALWLWKRGNIHKIKYDLKGLMRPLLCYGEFAQF